MTVTEALKRFRSDFKLTQKSVAQALEISPQLYSFYESKGELSSKVLLEIADTYNVSTDYLLGRSDNPEIKPPAVSEEDIRNLAATFNESAQALQRILEKQTGGAA